MLFHFLFYLYDMLESRQTAFILFLCDNLHGIAMGTKGIIGKRTGLIIRENTLL